MKGNSCVSWPPVEESRGGICPLPPQRRRTCSYELQSYNFNLRNAKLFCRGGGGERNNSPTDLYGQTYAFKTPIFIDFDQNFVLRRKQVKVTLDFNLPVHLRQTQLCVACFTFLQLTE